MFEAHIDLAGRMSITRRLPDDEEVFESLASRLRPLTVERESVFYETVLGAIECLVDPGMYGDEHREWLSQLRQAWRAAEIQGTEAQGYVVQSAQIDGTAPTGLISDTQLAAAWLYADLVHVDAKGPKEDALAFSLRERYAAAVRLFSHLAMLTVSTLRLVESLREAGALFIAESAWDDEVVVRASELVEEARVFVAPVDASIPDMRESMAFGEDWRPFTVTELLRQDPANQVQVTLTDDDGATVVSYDAALSRNHADDAITWQVLVAGSVLFKFAFDLHDGQVSAARFIGCDFLDTTNALKLASTQARIQLHHAASAVFTVQDQELFTLSSPSLSPEMLRDLEVVAEAVGDVVAIEHLTGQDLDPCNEEFDDRQRVYLRRARLMWEGHIVQAMRHPVSVTVPTGRPPQVLLAAAGTLDVGGAQVPTPRMLLRHPNMNAVEQRDVDQGSPTTRRYMVQPPEGGAFMAWSPDRVQVSNDDELVVSAPWDLLDIAEATFGY
ncbi:MAG TPA: hypothetical protein VNQ33_10385 [Acidimicrobiales bacterium]|nr:hypothetical protein [Acidimicrobiales bacterium]